MNSAPAGSSRKLISSEAPQDLRPKILRPLVPLSLYQLRGCFDLFLRRVEWPILGRGRNSRRQRRDILTRPQRRRGM